MKVTVSKFIHKIFFSVSANLITMLVSFTLALIVPKFIGLEEYGYWQLYTFYIGYVGFFHLGWADGIYLQYGGKYYDELDKPTMHSQYWLLSAFELLILLSIFIFVYFFVQDDNRSIILIASGLNCILLLPRLVLQNILQTTGRVKAYARNVIFERVICVILVFGFMVCGFKKFQYILIADLLAKTYAMISIAWICREIVFSKGVKFSLAWIECKNNISIGIKLMLANIAGFLIIGVVRFAIERTWDITTFGKVSFALSISNFILTFILAVSIVIFPMVKRTDLKKLPSLYRLLGALLSEGMVLFLVLYYPIKVILSLWLPEYSEAIDYLSILFPICIFESRTYLLVNTYLKALRQEKAMLWLNFLSVCISIVLTLFTVVFLENLVLTILSIVFLMTFKCMISDLYLQKKMGMRYVYDVGRDVFAVMVFILTNWFIGGLEGWGLYCLYVLILNVFRLNNNKLLYSEVKMLIL